MTFVLNSIPPIPLSSASAEMPNSNKLHLNRSISFIDNDSALENLENAFRDSSNKNQELVQVTKIFLAFEFQEMVASVSVVGEKNTIAKEVVSFAMNNLEIKCENKTYENDVQLTLKQICLKYVDHLDKALFPSKKQKELTLITSEANDIGNDLLSVRFLAVEKESPELSVRHKSVLKKLDVTVSCLTCHFHLESRRWPFYPIYCPRLKTRPLHLANNLKALFLVITLSLF
jgi:hypothetical protein